MLKIRKYKISNNNNNNKIIKYNNNNLISMSNKLKKIK